MLNLHSEMITGAHFLPYSTDADADRQFFRDVLGFPAVDAGEGWVMFALPPAEIGVHPSSENFVQRHARAIPHHVSLTVQRDAQPVDQANDHL